MHFRPKALLAENQIELWLICAVVKTEEEGHSILHRLNCVVRHELTEVWRLIHRRAGQKLPLGESRFNSPPPGEDCLSFSFFALWSLLRSLSIMQFSEVTIMWPTCKTCRPYAKRSHSTHGETKADKVAVMKESTLMARGWYWGFKFQFSDSFINHMRDSHLLAGHCRCCPFRCKHVVPVRVLYLLLPLESCHSLNCSSLPYWLFLSVFQSL